MSTKKPFGCLFFFSSLKQGTAVRHGVLKPLGKETQKAAGGSFHADAEGWCWRQASGELRLLGLWEQESHESCAEEQKGHQQNWHGAVCVHQLAEDDVPRDGCHSAHSREEAQSRGAGGQEGETLQFWKIHLLQPASPQNVFCLDMFFSNQ